jgi:glycogen debranching enzyme
MTSSVAKRKNHKHSARLHKENGGQGTLPDQPDDDRYYIGAAEPKVSEHNRTLKQGDTFAVFDAWGDFSPAGRGEEGLFHDGTRFLSALRVLLGERRPLVLSSSIKDDNTLLTVDLTNPDMADEAGNHSGNVVQRGTIHLLRSTFLWEASCYQRLHIHSFSPTPIETSVTIQFAADFADIFEVRGTRRTKRGKLLPLERENGVLFLPYQGLDGVRRRTCLEFSPPPSEVLDGGVRFDLSLHPQSAATIVLTIACDAEGQWSPPLGPAAALEAAQGSLCAARADRAAFQTDNDEFNEWINRSVADLQMLVTQTTYGPYPYAGIPWYSTVFGRDGLITALESLWLQPSLARGVLKYLAATQADHVDPDRDAEPGKIVHEVRHGEMAALREIPFGQYYGSIDSTPLFLMLAGAYYERTADRTLIESLWPNIERALSWIDKYGDRDGDSFAEYQSQAGDGLVQQGWKDSHDSVFHADGSPAEAPVALCEVQGYCYAARRDAAVLALALGKEQRASELASQAANLQARFEREFWCEGLGMYALALDGHKRPCRVRASNAGQCLFTGIASPERARRVAETLMSEAMFSGWGVRTLASTEVRYNPLSYHNGSVWPHDNALIAWGLDRYHLKQPVLAILSGMFQASRFVDLHRLPELWCGLPRREGEGPTLYPVACAPQAWSAAALLLLMQSALGMRMDAEEDRVHFCYPRLPEFLSEIEIRNLWLPGGSLDLRIERHHQDVSVEVVRREGNVGVTVVK